MKLLGKFRGLVTDVNDPDNQGRIKVQCPKVWGEYDGWCMPCVPYAPDTLGMRVPVQVGDGVWIEFEEGDTSKAIYTGFWWAKGKAPVNIGLTTSKVKIIENTDGSVKIEDSTGNSITFSSSGIDIVTTGRLNINGENYIDKKQTWDNHVNSYHYGG